MSGLPGLLRREDGVTIIMVLMFMFLAIPIVTGALTLASTLASDSRVRTEILYDQHTKLGAEEFAVNSVITGNDIDNDGSPGGTYDLTLNGTTTTITVTEGDLTGFVIPPEDGLQVTKVVTPTTVPAGSGSGTQTLTYTITVENVGTEVVRLKEINDGLPPEFVTYVTGSTVTTGLSGYADDPAETWSNNSSNSAEYLTLTWNLVSLRKQMAVGEIVTLQFQVQGTDVTGDAYCNDAWLLPEGGLSRVTGTAKVIAGSPADTVCMSERVRITTRALVFPNDGTHPVDPDGEDPGTPGDEVIVTYDITVENLWNQTLNVQKIINELPSEFVFVTHDSADSSTWGYIDPDNGLTLPTLTTAEGSKIANNGSSQRVRWNFQPGGGEAPIAAGTSENLILSAYLPLTPGTFWNETQFLFEEFGNEWVFSWPTSIVYLMKVSTVSINGVNTTVATLNGESFIDYGYIE